VTQPSQPSRPALPSWRDAFDAFIRPITTLSEGWVQTDEFMDALAVMWRLQRQTTRQFEAYVAAVLRFGGVPSRGDVLQVSNQVANLERQVRELVQAIEEK
jgi:hypothetical protein